VRGRAFCAIADIRPRSATFGEVATFELGDAPGERIRLYVSEGLANSFLTLDDTDYLYDVTDEFRPGIDKPSVAWDDPDLAVAWPVTDPVLSDADRTTPRCASSSPTTSASPADRPCSRCSQGPGAQPTRVVANGSSTSRTSTP
jgi:dTDP-4-dehydrorhamnose 3,5-epimerase